jgi:hypothetical protein
MDNIPFQIDTTELLKRLRMNADDEYAKDVRQLAEEAQGIGRPKALYKVSYVESRGEDFVVTDGVKLTSRVLRVNLEKAHRVFPFIATCGAELEEWSNSIDDVLKRYWSDTIKHVALGAARKALDEHLVERYELGMTSVMNPGSLADWPLPEQRRLFEILGDTEGAIGVKLTDSFLMVPTKSVSGLRFPTEVRFVNCQLCPREKCPGRRAAYDKDLYEKKYRAAKT